MIKELLLQDDTILVFDVDGVLAKMEYGKYNHFIKEEEWNQMLENDVNLYNESLVIKKVQDFISNKNKDNIYVITKVNHENEKEYKKEFVNKYYNIKKENVYFVFRDEEKADQILLIKEKYPNLEDYKIAMIDDTVNILNDIMDKTNFSTIHVSSLIDIL